MIQNYFPELDQEQLKKMEQLKTLYQEWNAKINVISRKDMDAFYTHHVLHSLSIVKTKLIKDGMSVMDVGTGGGFPGIPLAIFYPKVQFTLIDSIGKKIKVVTEVAKALELHNVTAIHERMEKVDIKVDMVVSRAVAPALKLIQFTKTQVKQGAQHVFIKGGGLLEEEYEVMNIYPKAQWKVYELKQWFNDPFFETKKIIHFKRN